MNGQRIADCIMIAGDGTDLGTLAKLIQAATKPWLMNLNVSMPLASEDLIRRLVMAARTNEIAGAFMALDLPVAMISERSVMSLLPRQSVALSQGPNAYRRALLLSLIENTDEADWQRQSFLEIATRHGHRIATGADVKTNINITTHEDWEMAQLLKGCLR